MNLKIFTGFKELAIITIAISGFWVIPDWAATAGPSYQARPDQKLSKQHLVRIAQSETRTMNDEKTALPSESSVSEPKTQEKKQSRGAQEKPLKEFRPTERIEADQAVDFPYDI